MVDGLFRWIVQVRDRVTGVAEAGLYSWTMRVVKGSR